MALLAPLRCPHASKQLPLSPREDVHHKAACSVHAPLCPSCSSGLVLLYAQAAPAQLSVSLRHASCLGTGALPGAWWATASPAAPQPASTQDGWQLPASSSQHTATHQQRLQPRQHTREEATAKQRQPAHSELTSSGHSPASTRKRELLPLPLGPMIITDCPRLTWKVRSRTRGVPSGAFSATLHQLTRASGRSTLPCNCTWRAALRRPEACQASPATAMQLCTQLTCSGSSCRLGASVASQPALFRSTACQHGCLHSHIRVRLPIKQRRNGAPCTESAPQAGQLPCTCPACHGRAPVQTYTACHCTTHCHPGRVPTYSSSTSCVHRLGQECWRSPHSCWVSCNSSNL